MIEISQRDLNALQRKFHALEVIDETGLKKEMYTAGALINRDMKKDAPVDTGNLRNNLGFEPKDNDVTIFSKAPYSGYVERGWETSKGKQVQPQPFFYKNIEKGVKILIKNLEYRIKRAIRR